MPELVSAWRAEGGDGAGRPDLPLPPGRMPAWRGRRPLKRWTWVGAFGPELMLCAAVAHVGPATAAWWAVWDGTTLSERSLRRRRGMVVASSRVDVPGVLSLEVGDAPGVEVVSPHGGQYIWTRKRGGVRVRGTALGREVDAAGLVDESAGYHARRTSWWWSCGAGVLASGSAVAWNLVSGVHDAPSSSERTVWLDGEPREVAHQDFADDLSAVGALSFREWSARESRVNLGLMRNSYRQPFGEFSGELPCGLHLAEGYGVMEVHDVRW